MLQVRSRGGHVCLSLRSLRDVRREVAAAQVAVQIGHVADLGEYTRYASAGIDGPDHVRLSDLEPLFVCQACSQRGADVRPDFASKEAFA